MPFELFSKPDYNSPEFTMTERTSSPTSRFAIERRKLESAWETIAIDDRNGVITTIVGGIEPIPGRIRDFRIRVPDRYPYEEPEAFPIGWNVSGPHCYPSTNQMCLWLPGHWSVRYTLAYTVAKTFTWVHKFEVYLGTGQWPGREQKH
jgi:hypothetical protein